MARRSKIDVLEATRLTRQGRLEEAMAVLRGDVDTPHAADTPPEADGKAFVDLVPPSAATGSAWTTPSAAAPAATAHRSETGSTAVPWLDGLLDMVLNRTATSGHEAPTHTPAPTARGGVAEPAPQKARLHMPSGKSFEERTFANEAGRRTYKLYVPGRFDGQPLPLLVMLHGCTQSPDDFATGTRMNELAEEHGFFVAYPAQSHDANASGCWNWFNAGDQRRDRGEPSLIAGITRQIMDDFPVDPERVFAAGLSAGGATAAIMGATYPDLYRAIGVHSGLACGAARDMSSAFSAMRQGGHPSVGTVVHRTDGKIVPTIVFHGDGDRTVHPLNGAQVVAQVAAQLAAQAKAEEKLAVTITSGQTPEGIGYTREVQSDDTGRSVLEHWVLHGAGHAWSGGSPSGSYTEPRGPDASREMVRFFLQTTSVPGG
ncbi:PHB depolymerase family esterase [Xanthobacter sp. DSM 14520]|uniref:extracellular catalytic domain type 1 short-chain-length polyhydroxyalkanoate depolymerase n=1 Tax=Xanthobacter autotrophicus (strain ATCC BAA-1158 / Py2) TaxID=78245 RepID=UPI00372695F7